MLDFLDLDVQVVLAVLETLVEFSFRPGELADPHSERCAPETRGRAEIIRPAIDDEAGQFAFMHRFLQIRAP
jgi:hypothetical protein